ncbi:MAG: glycosyltransferase [Lachnospiraceae bacterium]|nr:glycosyltransferase [Lachnospiraceae bacterium]
MKKVSVIIPVYNAEKYIEKCLDSVCTQTLKDIEVIAVNDGSTDESLSLLRMLEGKYSCLTVIDKENGGASSARNAGLDCAKGEYIGFVDSDDWVEPDMYEVLYNEAVKADADVVFCNLYKNDDIKMQQFLETGVYTREKIKQYIYPRLISSEKEKQGEGTLRGSVVCKFFRRELIEKGKIRFADDLVYNEDGLFSIMATFLADKYLYLGDRYLYHNRINSNSITKRYIPDLWNRQKVFTYYVRRAKRNTDYNFDYQIEKKLFDIAVYSIENIMKKNNKMGFWEKKNSISSIMKDEDLTKAIDVIEKDNLKKINTMYYRAIKLKSALLAMMTVKYRYR